MKLKDYIHYYYGCEFIANGMRYTIDRIDRLIKGTRQNPFGREVWNDFEPHKIKLVLRRLEDMTEEEARGFLNHAKPHSEYIFHNEHAVCWQYQGSKSEIWFLFGPPAGFHYLLQQSFDLFGLIDAGLAINIKTLTP